MSIANLRKQNFRCPVKACQSALTCQVSTR